MGKNILKKEPIIVYWAPEAEIEKEHQQVLLEMELQPVLKDIHKRRSKDRFLQSNNPNSPLPNGYQMCTALHELCNNMYYIKAPFETHVTFYEDLDSRQGHYADWFQHRYSSIDGAMSADFRYSYMLFCEESLEVSLTPPYLHKTSQPEYGFVCSVKWDISSWFRPHILIYQLWEGKNQIYFKKDEPLAYLTFNTDRPIIFKEYKLTQEILNISSACLEHKRIIPFEPMKRLYEKFTKTSIKKRLSNEIKKNLI
jgi:hypothetical protein